MGRIKYFRKPVVTCNVKSLFIIFETSNKNKILRHNTGNVKNTNLSFRSSEIKLDLNKL